MHPNSVKDDPATGVPFLLGAVAFAAVGATRLSREASQPPYRMGVAKKSW